MVQVSLGVDITLRLDARLEEIADVDKVVKEGKYSPMRQKSKRIKLVLLVALSPGGGAQFECYICKQQQTMQLTLPLKQWITKVLRIHHRGTMNVFRKFWAN